jgi:uncharacterized membrane protein
MDFHDFASSIALLLIGLIPYLLIIYFLPKWAMKRALQVFATAAGGFNKIHRYDNPDHFARLIPAPCPDFLYTVVPLDFSLAPSSTIFVVRAPGSEYCSLGVYDDSTLCQSIINHSKKPLAAVICGPGTLAANNEDITEAARAVTDDELEIVRVETTTGLLLHRLFTPDPSDSAIEKKKQQDISVTPLELKSTENATKSPAVTVTSVIVFYLAFTCYCGSLLWDKNGSIMILTWMGILVADVLAGLFTLLVLKNGYFTSVFEMAENRNMGCWYFCGLKLRSSNANGYIERIMDIFGILYYFLHGALGLLSSEVVYGTVRTDSDGNRLEYGIL